MRNERQPLTTDSILRLLGRERELFAVDMAANDRELAARISDSRFLIIGGAGSIGHATTREIFHRSPRALHVVDINENAMAEAVRDFRSSLGYIEGDYRTFILDCGTAEYDTFLQAEGPYDYVLNFSALKHVRSERDPFTLMRMVRTNVLNTEKTISQARQMGSCKYFCVSTDKATNPVNMMGASKRIMEMFLMRDSLTQPVSTARFANVAFSDGGLLHAFTQRLRKEQPISAPTDVRRYFITPKESGELCLLSCLLGNNRDIFFPKLSADLTPTALSDIAIRFLEGAGYKPVICSTEEEARQRVTELASRYEWPCFFSESDTTGEKEVEEFYTSDDNLDIERFQNIGVIENGADFNGDALDRFSANIAQMLRRGTWSKQDLVDLFSEMIPEFQHRETHKYLDGKM